MWVGGIGGSSSGRDFTGFSKKVKVEFEKVCESGLRRYVFEKICGFEKVCCKCMSVGGIGGSSFGKDFTGFTKKVKIQFEKKDQLCSSIT